MRVAVFIDNSNVFRSIKILRDNGEEQWPNFYDPLYLSQKLAGNRKIVYIGFYCVSPPAYLLTSGDRRDYARYTKTQRYYSRIESLNFNTADYVSVKYGELKYNPNSASIAPHEKNVDTQIVADMIVGAAKGIYDVAILVSNDGDYVSGIEGVKEFGKRTEVIFFRGMISNNLARNADLRRRARPSYFRLLSINN